MPRKSEARLNAIQTLEKLMRFRPTLEECASFLGVSEDSVSRIIRATAGKTFSEFRDYYFGPTKIQLRKKAVHMALAGDRTMLIFALKNLCGWQDNPNIQSEQDVDVEFDVRERGTE